MSELNRLALKSQNGVISYRHNADVYGCYWQFDVIVAFETAFAGIAFDMTLLNSSILCFKCTWIIQLFSSVFEEVWIQNVVNISLTFATGNISIVL